MELNNHHLICMLIDDDSDDQEIFALALKEADPAAKCISVNDAMEGLRLLRSGTVPDIIFLDVNMHKINGLACLREIRKIGGLDKVRVIMTSTAADPAVIRQCFALGAEKYMVKPPGLEPYVKALQDTLKQENIT
ncbi:response regulator [Flavihumibacter petaseus]|uniref:Putative two-component response regulator n=1 Tax=Flavihumibacter petaseus NBRC 106054 TaxID=1220578 RepID=A0A0E9N218_9BACT|nr:response regulator [Flavihumibacter petaseus]GAO43853.1 putative two-component response regulator [Flavihumibacter petaseus NBRC 106054]